MKSLLLLALTLPVIADPIPVLIGTNTSTAARSEGIYTTTFDPEKGTFSETSLAIRHRNPGFLALHPTLPIVYTTGSSEKFTRGSIAAFSLTAPHQPLGEVSSGGVNPCHLAVHPKGHTLAVANYSDGTTATLPLDPKGILSPPAGSARISGKGPRTDRQEGPHAHGVYFHQDTLLVPDLGLDRVLSFRTNEKSALLHQPTSDWTSSAGAGPRHLAFSPDHRHAYVVNELSNTVSACSFDPAKGTLTTIQEIPTLPDDFTGSNTTAEIEVHPSGNFVYASNRGHDSIAAYRRDPATGKLSLIHIAPCGGKTPRHFTFSPDGKWLVCAHQDSNTLTALALDPSTGKLSPPGPTTPCPAPICILFLPAKP